MAARAHVVDWRILACILLMVLAGSTLSACESAEQLRPVRGRLTTLVGEGIPPGYISGEIPPQYKGLTNPYTLQDQAAVTAGERVYLGGAGPLSCAFCHGAAGRGYGPRALYIDQRPPDYASEQMLNMFRNHADYAFWHVSEGIDKTVMPAFKDLLTEDERWQAITYAWYLGEQAAGTSPVPRRERIE
ncbi:MAG: c-type cytochrome [Chloroflexota bacterium]